LPTILSDIVRVTDVIYDVAAVSFDTWVYATSGKYIIEIYHEGEVTIGWKSDL
jgi:hypothetical protein